VSSVKRWTDEGALKSVKTIGGHRRYRPRDLHEFARLHDLPTEALPPDDPDAVPSGDHATLARAILDSAEAGQSATVRRMVSRTLSATNRISLLDTVIAPVLAEIGRRWSSGAWTVEQEHRFSNLLAETIDHHRPGPADEGPLALLACPPEELHDLPLRMVRLILESNDWQTDFLGASVPWQEIRGAAARLQPELILLSGRDAGEFSSAGFDDLVSWCTRHGIEVGIGGGWARGGRGRDESIHRFRSLRGFERWLRSRNAALRTRSRPSATE